MEYKTRIVAVIIQNSKLLLLKGIGYEELWTPGGKIKFKETDEECLRRELKEEINVKLIKTKFFKQYSEKSFYDPDEEVIEKVYITTINGKLKPNAEIEKIIWITKDDLKNQKYKILPTTEKEIIPDLIREGMF